MAGPSVAGIARGPWGDKAPLSPHGGQHLPECQEYRRIYLSDVGVISDRVCCCDRIRQESANQ